MIDEKTQPRPAATPVISVISSRRDGMPAFYRSSVGKKMIVAVTGVILIVFVIGHLLGNLQIFLGPDWINGYSEHLHNLGPLLWLIRGFLLVVVLAHIYYT